MATQEIIWNWNNFRWGLSDNPYIGQEGQFQDWFYVDVQTEPNWFKLTSDFNSILTTASAPNVIIDGADYGEAGSTGDNLIYTFCSNGEIYKGTSTTPIYTDVTWSPIVQATMMWVSTTLYIYYFTGIWTIHRIATDGTGHTTKWSLTWSTQYPLVKYGWDIYFCDYNVFRKLDSAETLTTIFTASKENIFTGITFFQDSFHLYSSLWSAGIARDWQQFIIRVGQNSPDYVTKWDRLPILGACNQWSTDYVVTWFSQNYSDLYIVSGTQRQLSKSNFEWMTLGRKFNGKIISWKDEVFMLWRNKDTAGTAVWNAVFRLGKYFPGMPQALTEIFRGNSGWELYSIFAWVNNLYIWRKWTSSVYSVTKINLDTPVTTYTASTGYIVSNVYTGWDATIVKHMKEIEISYMCDNTNPYFPHGGTISLYARKNPIDSWTQIGSNYTKTDIGRIKITQQEINNANMGDYTQIELQCNVSQWSSTLSPLVTGIKVTSTININE